MGFGQKAVKKEPEVRKLLDVFSLDTQAHCLLLSPHQKAGSYHFIGQIIEALMPGEEVKPPYTIEDMAAGTVGLLGALSIEKAHQPEVLEFMLTPPPVEREANIERT